MACIIAITKACSYYMIPLCFECKAVNSEVISDFEGVWYIANCLTY